MAAMRFAAARAASRRGSKRRMVPSPSHAGRERSMARGRVVVLPAPGGAWSTSAEEV